MPAARKIRLVYLVAQPVRWVAFEWIGRLLDPSRFDLRFLLLNDGPPPLARHFDAAGIRYQHLPFRSRRDVPRVAAWVARYGRHHRPDIVHTHFMDACLAGLLGAWLSRVPVRIHTRHHAGPFDASYRPGWQRLFDHLNNALSTHIVAPSVLVERRLVEGEGVPASSVVRVPHGFDLEAFCEVPAARVAALRAKYGLPDGSGPVIGTVARYEAIKGLQYVIPAFRRLRATYPSARLVLANARGRYQATIRALLATLPAESYVEIPFEEDIFALYQLFDAFVHVPVAPAMEAFGQVYVEALAAGVPSVITPAGVSGEFVVPGREAWVVGFREVAPIYDGLRAILEDKALRCRLAENGRLAVQQRFGIAPMVRSLEALYLEATGRESSRRDSAALHDAS